MKSMSVRRFLAFLVSVAMVVTLTPTYAFADVLSADQGAEVPASESSQASESADVQADESPDAVQDSASQEPGALDEEQAEVPEQPGEKQAEDAGALPEEQPEASEASDEVQKVKRTAPAVKGEGSATRATVSFKERSWDGSKLIVQDASHVADPFPSSKNVAGGWYYLADNVTVSGRVCLSGDTNLILSDGKTLDVKGLYIPKGSTLTIYGQKTDDTASGVGRLYSHPSSGSGIGAYAGNKGGSIVIHGGSIEANGYDHCAGIGGNDDDRTDIGAITIYGGKIKAKGGESGAGIGGGRACEGGNITIYGGDVTANGGHYGAGIGGGNGQDTNPMRGAHAGTIKIYGGTVTATGGDDGAGIGGGEGGNAGTIEISGGLDTTKVTATGGNNSAGIGCGEGESTGIGGTVTISGGTVTATGGGDAAGIGGGEDGHCATITISGTTETTKVTATGGSNGAGIGAGRDADGGTIKISGGTVIAEGKNSSAGIGGGDASGSFADYSYIEITGGTVTSTGNSKGAGIGGGEYGHATVTITGGTINATGGSSGGAGIGNGKDGSGSTVILGWSEATKDIEITTNSYSGIVKLNQPFKNTRTSFEATGLVANNAALAANPPLVADTEAVPSDTPAEEGVSTWAALQEKISSANSACSIKLNESVYADGASYINVPTGKDITIDLNGKTMDRQLTDCVESGSVIRVESGATLTIIDNSTNHGGLITGGAAVEGGGIYNAGTLTVSGGTISQNKASERGGGIFMPGGKGAVLNLNGGAVRNNTCSINGGGIHVSSTATMTVSGTVQVTDNKKGEAKNNLNLAEDAFVVVTKALDANTEIGVSMSKPSAGNITSGLQGKGSADNFVSDNTNYTTGIDGGGEAYLPKAAEYEVDDWTELQDAVNEASNGDVIQLDESLTCPSGGDRIRIEGNKSITIDLAGCALNRGRKSEDGDGHVIQVFEGSKLTIRDSVGGGQITGGYSTRGGGIYVSKNATCIITGGSVTSNRADDDGGGIYVRGTLKMTGGSVVRNSADDCGGGIYVTDEGTIDLTGVDISYNESDDDGAGLKVFMKENSRIAHSRITYNVSDDCGGGLFVDAKGKTLTLVDTAIDKNESDDDGAGIYLNNGTIIMNGGSLSENATDNDSGGAKITKNTTFTATGVTINGNIADTEEGGGVKNFGTTKLVDCTISNNTSKKQGGGIFNDDSDGSAGMLTLEGCTITGNRSIHDNGGGVYSDYKLTLSSCKITGNAADIRGGGVFIGDDSKDTYISGGLIVKDNRAKVGGKDIYLRTHKLVLTNKLTRSTEKAEIGITKENDNGLGVFTGNYSVYNGATNQNPSDFFFSPESLEVVQGTGGEASLASGWNELRSNLKNLADGETLVLDKNYTASSKGDYLEIPEGKTITIDMNGKTLNRNRSSKDGDGHVIWVKKNARLILVDNSNAGGGTITGGYSKRGGGIYVDEDATCEITGVNVKENRASDDGAGIYVKGYLKATNCTISDNVAGDNGGGIFSEDTGHIDLDGVTVTGNDCDNDGAGMKLWLSTDSTIKNSEISHNRSEDHGGGLYMDAGGKKLTITNTKFDENESSDDGAGIFLYKGTIEMTGGSISKNESANDSGGIKVTSKTTFTATNVTISGNKAKGEEGGGVKNYGTTTLVGCTISNNKAGENGGGIFNDNDGSSAGKLTVDGCTFTGNKADDDGGAIYSDKKLVLKGSTAKPTTIGGSDANKNEASGGGGIKIGADSDETEISGKIVITNNSATRGPDVYLRKGQKLTLTGAITDSDIGIIDMDNIGVFTKDYSKYHPATDASGAEIAANNPTQFFCKSTGAIPCEWYEKEIDGNKVKTEAKLHSYWPDLQAAINAAAIGGGDGADGHEVVLDKDYRAGSSDVQLKIEVKEGSNAANNGHVTIDLNGHALNRNCWDDKKSGHVIQVYEDAVLTVKDSKASKENLEENTGIITGGNADKGGAIYISEDATVNFESGTIAGNRADDHGGGIFTNGTLNMTGGLIAMNNAEDNGGAIYAANDSKLSLDGVTISNNNAGDNGGGINICSENDATIKSCKIDNNLSGDYGGGLRLDDEDCTLTIEDTKIEENTSYDDGGGVYLRYGTINMTGTTDGAATVKDNISANDAGGIKATSKTTFTANNVTISDNRAALEEGGGVKNYGTMTLTNCTIKNNSAKEQGGGIYNDNDGKSAGDLTLDNCTIVNNKSEDDGGGVYSDNKLKIIGGTIGGTETVTNSDGTQTVVNLGNSAERGGGVYIGSGSKDTKVEGKVVIKDNKATKTGNNLFLKDDRMLTLTGALSATEGQEGSEQTANAEINLDLEEGVGEFAKDYLKYYPATDGGNEPSVDPATFFKPATGYAAVVNKDKIVELTSGWKALKAQVEAAKSGDPDIVLYADYAAKKSDDRIKIDEGKSITVDLNGHTINRNRSSKDEDGHVFEVLGTLTIKDSRGARTPDGSSVSEDLLKTGIITGGWAENGGGINIAKTGTLNFTGGQVSGNRATHDGGGIYAHGTLNMTGGTVQDNKAEHNGGGIGLDDNSVMSFVGGTVTKNTADNNGGGIKVDARAKINVKGNPVVSGNKATKNASDIYLPKLVSLNLTGELAEKTEGTEGAKLCVALEDHRGVFTSGYNRYNGDDDPAKFFKSTEGYEVQKKSGEVELAMGSFGKTENSDSFVSWRDQIDTDSEGLSSYNWMAGVSGERYLNEINYPRTHDSAMNKIDDKKISQGITEIVAAGLVVAFAITFTVATMGAGAGIGTLVVGLLAAGTTLTSLAMPNDCTAPASFFLEDATGPRAKTQTTWIYEQLEQGARRLDLRLNNKKKVYKFLSDDCFNGWTYSDDGRNLYHTHGKKAFWGTYHALDPDGDYQSLDETLSWVKAFLTEHPTETIILNLTPETSKTGDLRTIRERTRTILEHSLLDINPSTEEPFLYKEAESNDYFAYYTRPPKLADCRGKILIYTGDDMGHYVGGAGHLNIPQPDNGASFSEQPGKHMDSLRKGAAKLGLGEVDLPTDADTHINYQWFWGTSCTGEDPWYKYVTTDPPYKLAQDINPSMIGEGKLFDPVALNGKYIGCLSMDDYQAEYGEAVWRTNFFKGLQYRTVTVKSGDDDANPQTYTLLKGTELTVPGNIYNNVGKGTYFAGWKADDGTICNKGDSFKVNEDVTFTAQWLVAGEVPVRVVWKDGDDKDGLRPDSVTLKAWVDSERSDMTLSSEESWMGVIEDADNKQVTLVPDFDLVNNGQYSYSVDFEDGAGYVVTLVHTPDATETVSGKVVWDDDDDAAEHRPQSATVRLQKNGVEAQSQDVTESNDWSYSFEVPQYENGEKVSYSIDAEPVDHYQVSIEDGTITYTYVEEADTVSVIGSVEWDDASDAKGIRPEKTTLTLVAGDKEVSTADAALNSEDPWTFEFEDVPAYDDKGNPIDNYGLVPEQIPGYSVKCEAVTLYGEDDPTGDGSDGAIAAQSEVCFRVTYTLDPDKTEPAEVVENPQAREAIYTGEPQELVDKGSATGGTMVYALGADSKTAPAADAFAEALPTATDAGIYHVWYYVKGDMLHTDTVPTCVEATIDKAEQEIRAKDVEGFTGEFGKVVQATVKGIEGSTEGVGALSFKVTAQVPETDGDEVASIDATTGALTLLAPGTATVNVHVTETANYSETSIDVTVTVVPGKRTVTFYEDTEGTKVWEQVELEDSVFLDALADYGNDADHPLKREGYTLAGWATEPGIVVDSYKDKRGALNRALVGKLVNWNAGIDADIDAYPIWIRDRLEVHLDKASDEAAWGIGYDGEEQSDSFTVNIDEKIDMTGLNSTKRDGYTLDGWYTSGGVKWDKAGSWGVTPEYCDRDGDGKPIVGKNSVRKFNYYTVTLTAHWSPVNPSPVAAPDGQRWTITFDTKGGTPEIAPIEQVSGTEIARPADPTKKHYTFDGWYPALPTTMPNGGLAVEATWVPTVYHVAFYDGDKQLYLLEGGYGSKVEAPEDPVKEGSVFAGWVNGTGQPVTFPMYLNGEDQPDLTQVYATWKTAQEPPAVNAEAIDAYSVKVANPIRDAEYIIVSAGEQPDAKYWTGAKQVDAEGAVVFGGLKPATSYDVWGRMAAIGDKAPSEAAKATVTTLKEVQVAPPAPAGVVVDGTTVTIEGADPAMEYALVAKGGPVPADDAAWSSAGDDGKVQWDGCDPNAEYAVYARRKATDSKAASAESLPIAVTTGEPPAPAPEPAPEEEKDKMGADGTPCGKGASAATAEKAILALAGEADPAGSKVAPLLLKSKKQKKSSVKLSWTRPSGAVKFVVYGAACKKGSKMAKVATVTGKALTAKKVAGKKLAKATYYRFVVVALDKGGNVVSTSKAVHVATKGKKKASNPTKVKVAKKVLKKAKKLKVGKTLKLKAKALKKKGTKIRKHAKLRYESSDPSIATVNAKGAVKGVKKGTAYVYAYAQNGAAKKVKVSVK